MTDKPNTTNDEKSNTEQAWNRLQKKLANEPNNPKWAAWPVVENIEHNILNHVPGEMIATKPSGGHNTVQVGKEAEGIVGASEQDAARGRRRRKMNGRRKWAALAVSAVIFGIMLATPVGNKALAAILNQFRVQDVAVVNHEDLQHVFDQITEGKRMNKTNNKFGEFTNVSGNLQGEFIPEKASRLVGFPLLPGQVTQNPKKVDITPSTTLTLNLHVDEVNLAMKRLGATALLPASVDGKPISLTMPETVYYQLNTDKKNWSTISQSNLPVLTVDPSIQVEEALDAVIHFPLLPEDIKLVLQKSSILSGEITFPIVAGNNTSQIMVNGTKVILQKKVYNNFTHYFATWIKGDQLFTLRGDGYADEAAFMNQLKGLIDA